MRSFAVDISPVWDERPWGYMRAVHVPGRDLTVKYLYVREGHRTSLQYHERKDEWLLVIDGTGCVETDTGDECAGAGHFIHIPPGRVHRVTGPLSYMEISTYDAGDDTIRLEDDYGRGT